MSKWYIVSHADQFANHPLVGFVYHLNYNIAFSIPVSGTISSLLALIVLVGVVFQYGNTIWKSTIWTSVTLGLIFGGAIGNIIDRFLYNGAVIDFIKIGVFPVFNIADSAITLGVLITLLFAKYILK